MKFDFGDLIMFFQKNYGFAECELNSKETREYIDKYNKQFSGLKVLECSSV